tara:strand:+ start:437 stop:979 length:543 start_codon:yes stop_codon:yes gene_type:complete
MFFLPFASFLLANQQLNLQESSVTPLQESLPLEEVISIEEVLEVKPFFLEGSVDNFDPVSRAVTLAKTLPRNLCGSYRSFDSENVKVVSVVFSEIQPIGQILTLKGKMSIDNKISPIAGILNAKSDQLELFPLAKNEHLDLDSGGSFIGLQGAKLLTWKSSRLDKPGGRLELKAKCSKNF